MVKNEQVYYYIYEDINGNILVSEVFLEPIEVNNRQLWLAMETSSRKEMVDFISDTYNNNTKVIVEFFDNREVF